MIKQVTKYQTVDGQVFDTEKEAEGHEFELTFANWYDKNSFCTSNAVSVYSEDVWAWFKKHRSKLLNFLNKIS